MEHIFVACLIYILLVSFTFRTSQATTLLCRKILAIPQHDPGYDHDRGVGH
ncbi:hypothetical protein HanPI659440_Chr03g0110761 [Helianthus annuus]|nr:hypothetical protein HanPI659440_Chr03g0110761 [Helianthus annuus]